MLDYLLGDDPVVEHTRWFPQCPYIIKLVGEQYVDNIRRNDDQTVSDIFILQYYKRLLITRGYLMFYN